MNVENLIKACPCGSKQEYNDCCKPLHDGALPKNAHALMRARYSAYVLDLPDYVIATTHPASPQYSENKFGWKRSISQFSRNSQFDHLEILDFKEQHNLAIVTFTAYLAQNGHDTSFTERSYFEKIGAQWLYRGGQLAQGHAPNLITTGQLMLLPLAYYGEAILNKPSEPVFEITPAIEKLVQEMIQTMDVYDGVGLAAPQVHHAIRLFIMRTPIENNQGGYGTGELQVYINPTISFPSKEMWRSPEGCLSIPTVRAQVERPHAITIEYTTLEGKTLMRRVSGWEARIMQHEYDHIEGILFIDRLPHDERVKLKPLLKNLKKRIHDGQEL